MKWDSFLGTPKEMAQKALTTETSLTNIIRQEGEAVAEGFIKSAVETNTNDVDAITSAAPSLDNEVTINE